MSTIWSFFRRGDVEKEIEANYEKTEYSKFYKKTKDDEDICKKLRYLPVRTKNHVSIYDGEKDITHEMHELLNKLTMYEDKVNVLKGELKSKLPRIEQPEQESIRRITCPICSHYFVTPMTLNCSHTFCKWCIDSWTTDFFQCPTCRTPINYITHRMVLDLQIQQFIDDSSQKIRDNYNSICHYRIQDGIQCR